jgi:hypothetical protein
MKICTKCDTNKELIEFYWEKKRQRYRSICIACEKEKSLKRYQENPEKNKATNKKWIENNKEKFKQLVKNNRGKYKEYDQQYAKEYYLIQKENPDYQLKQREYQREYKRKRRKDSQYKLKENLRTYFYQTITNKTNSVFEYLACSTEEFKLYLEKQFDENMNWGNYGEYWEIDHIKPIETFNFLNETEIYECWNYKNLQPLTINENRTKRYKKI